MADPVEQLAVAATEIAAKGGPPPWPEIEALGGDRIAPLPYPVDSLSPTIRGAVERYQRFGQQPMALIASSALSTASLATQGLADVARDPNLSGPCSLNFCIIARSGERKTSCDRRFRVASSRWQAAERERQKPEIEKAVARLAAWQAGREGLLAAIRKASASASTESEADRRQLEKDLEDHESKRPHVPPEVTLLVEDSTPEALAQDLGNGWPSSSIWSDEAGLVIGSHAMSETSAMRFLGLLNRLWDGGSFTRRRTTKDNITIEGRRFTVSLMTQPMVIEELISGNGGLARGIGMLARFLICWPESTIGQRLYVEGDLDAEELRAFDARVTELLGMPLPVRDEISMILEPPILELDPEAFAMWRKFYDGSERDLGRHGEYAELTDFGAKIAEQAARVAGVMHVFEHGPVGQISAETMESACTIAGWHLYEARRVFGLIEIDRATQDAQLLLEWLEGQPTPPTLKIMAQFAPFRLRSKSRRDQAIDKLAAHGIARLESRDGSTVMVLNPAWRS